MVQYKSDGVFDAPIEKLWKYMDSEYHQHKAFKSFKVVNESGNKVTLEVEVFNPDGKTTNTQIITHTMNPPHGFETSMSGGMMDGAKLRHTYTPMGDRTKVEMEGDFKAISGMDESAQLKMVDEFFTTAFNEDNENLKKMK